MQIRATKPSDIPDLQLLIAISVRDLSGDYYTSEQIESAIKYVFGVDTQLVTDGTYYVVEENNTIAACGGWSKRETLYGGDQHKNIADPLLNPATDAARIRAFFVHPNHTRKGIGKLMIELCEAEALKHGFTATELSATLPGVPLYTAMGYKEIMRVLVDMPDGVQLPIVKMHKKLIT